MIQATALQNNTTRASARYGIIRVVVVVVVILPMTITRSDLVAFLDTFVVICVILWLVFTVAGLAVSNDVAAHTAAIMLWIVIGITLAVTIIVLWYNGCHDADYDDEERPGPPPEPLPAPVNYQTL